MALHNCPSAGRTCHPMNSPAPVFESENIGRVVTTAGAGPFDHIIEAAHDGSFPAVGLRVEMISVDFVSARAECYRRGGWRLTPRNDAQREAVVDMVDHRYVAGRKRTWIRNSRAWITNSCRSIIYVLISCGSLLSNRAAITAPYVSRGRADHESIHLWWVMRTDHESS